MNNSSLCINKKPTTNLLTAIFIFSFINCFAGNASKNQQNEEQILKGTPEEIVFYSNGSVFSPVVVLQDNAEILWTWDDNTISNSATPRKDYGTEKLRKNTLKVTPWSAVRRINIGYDAGDAGSPEIELVENQHVSKVENLELIAPYLKEWCSSYNLLTSLDFSNFVNLETIECYLSHYLKSIDLTNTPKLKRACFVINSLQELDLSDCINLKELLIGSNPLTKLLLPNKADSLWYVGARYDSLLINQNTFNDFSKYPNISHISIWSSKQKGSLVIPKTHPTRWVWIRAFDNQYTALDFRGALQNSHEVSYVDLHHNKLTKVDIEGCSEIRTLDLSDNKLSSQMVDSVLKQLDEFGPTILERNVNLSKNKPPTALGLTYKKNIEAKGWKVIVDPSTTTVTLDDPIGFNVYPNPTHGSFHLHLNKIPREGVTVQITDINGHQLLTKNIDTSDSDWSVTQFHENIFFITLKGSHFLETKRISKN
jgi:hypothetical protein